MEQIIVTWATMGRVTENPRSRFNTVAGIRKYFTDQQWPLPSQVLDQSSFIKEQAQQANARFPEAFINPRAHTFPKAMDLFALALDAESGPFPHLRGLRFRASRLMARRRPEDLGPPIKLHCGKTYGSGDALATTIKRIEAGKSIGDDPLIAALADTYHVDLAWLSGYNPESGTNEHVDHVVRRARGYGPTWLRPWQAATRAAISVCHALQHQRTMIDLFLSDPSYAGEMLERFFERRTTDMLDPSGTWSSLVYFPLVQAAMVEVRDRTMDAIPSWMMFGA